MDALIAFLIAFVLLGELRFSGALSIRAATHSNAKSIQFADDSHPADWGLIVVGFANKEAQGDIAMTERVPNVDWNAKQDAFHDSLPEDHYSLIFSGYIGVPENGNYGFLTKCDDGSVLTIDGTTVVNNWVLQPAWWAPKRFDQVNSLYFAKGTWYSFELVYFENGHNSRCQVWWMKDGNLDTLEVIPAQYFRSEIGPRLAVSEVNVPIHDEAGAAEVEVWLTHEPSSDVAVTFDNQMFKHIQLSACAMVFSPSNYNVKQKLKIIPKLSHKNSGTAKGLVVATAESQDEHYNSQSVSIKPTKQHKAKHICHSWGDPHFKTFDNRKFDFYDQGDFYLYRQRDGLLTIQTRQEPCRKVSCNYGMVAKYMDSSIYISVDKLGNYNFAYENQISNVTVREISSKHYKISFPNGVSVRVKISYWGGAPTWYLNIYISGPPSLFGTNQVSGLCGNFDGDRTNDLTDLSGNTYSSSSAWARTFIVPDNENLFIGGTVPGLSGANEPVDVPEGNVCSGDPEAQSMASEEGTDISSVVAAVPKGDLTPSFDETFVPIEPEDPLQFDSPEQETEFTNFCTQHFGPNSALIAACGDAIGFEAQQQYFDICLADACHSGSLDFAAAAVAALQDECGAAIEANQADDTSDDTTQTATVQSYSLCPSMCSFHGTCSAEGVCTCEEGYGGDDCGQQAPNTDCWSVEDVSSVEVNDERCETTLCWKASTQCEGISSPIQKFSVNFPKTDEIISANIPYEIADGKVHFSLMVSNGNTQTVCVVLDQKVSTYLTNSEYTISDGGDFSVARTGIRVPDTFEQCSKPNHCPYSIVEDYLNQFPLVGGQKFDLFAGLSVAGYYTIIKYDMAIEESSFAWNWERTSEGNFPVAYRQENIPIILTFDIENTNNYKCRLETNINVSLEGFIHWTGTHFWSSNVELPTSSFNAQCECFPTPGNECKFHTPSYFRTTGGFYDDGHHKYWHEQVVHAQKERLGWGIKDLMNSHVAQNAQAMAQRCQNYFASN
eukprot:Nk52_evm53s212 gene=Nk52_evmTU53s212